jgi:Sap, sulfolipid-1-addressing protein
MGKLQTATPRFAFRLGLLLFLFMPTDLITTFTVGATLARNSESLLWAIPFVLLTAFFVAIPLLILLLLGHRADAILPKIREWMSDNSWVVSELVILLFVLITLSGM